jgi:hypothetical protein
VADLSNVPPAPADIVSGSYLGGTAYRATRSSWLLPTPRGGTKQPIYSPTTMDTSYFAWSKVRIVPKSTLDALDVSATLG